MVPRLRIERSGFELWPGTLFCVLTQDTLLSQCLSTPRCIDGAWELNSRGNPAVDWHPVQGGGVGGGGGEDKKKYW